MILITTMKAACSRATRRSKPDARCTTSPRPTLRRGQVLASDDVHTLIVMVQRDFQMPEEIRVLLDVSTDVQVIAV